MANIDCIILFTVAGIFVGLILFLLDLILLKDSNPSGKLEFLVKYLRDPDPLIELPRDGDIGIDIYSSVDIDILLNQQATIPTGIAVEIPNGYALIIKDRSSMSKTSHVLAGVVDSSYRGEIKVVLRNHGIEVLRISKGQKIAQMILVENLSPRFAIKIQEDLSETDRGQKGFGSTGT